MGQMLFPVGRISITSGSSPRVWGRYLSLIHISNFISSYDENPSYQAVQANTVVDIEFIHPAAGTEVESLQLLLASGELPDMIQVQREDWYSGRLKALYEDGAIIDIAPYLDEYAPQYKEVINHDEVAQRQIIDDGKVYGFYKITYAAVSYTHLHPDSGRKPFDRLLYLCLRAQMGTFCLRKSAGPNA